MLGAKLENLWLKHEFFFCLNMKMEISKIMKIIRSSIFFQFYDMENLTNLIERERERKHSQVYMGKTHVSKFPHFLC
jgi:hypothetical protein